VLRGANGRGGDPLEPFYFLDGIDVASFDRFLERCFGDGAWQNTFGVGPGTRSFVTSIGCPHRCILCRATGVERHRAKLNRPIPLRGSSTGYCCGRSRRTKARGPRQMVNVRTDFEGPPHAERLDCSYDFPNGMRADHLSPPPRGDRLIRAHRDCSVCRRERDGRRSRRAIGKGQPLQPSGGLRNGVVSSAAVDEPLHHRDFPGNAGARHSHPRDAWS